MAQNDGMDPNHPGRVKRSDMVQNVRNIFPDVLEGPACTNTRYWSFQGCPEFKNNGYKRLEMVVSDLNHLLGRVKRPDWVQNDRNTFPGVAVWLACTRTRYCLS